MKLSKKDKAVLKTLETTWKEYVIVASSRSEQDFARISERLYLAEHLLGFCERFLKKIKKTKAIDNKKYHSEVTRLTRDIKNFKKHEKK